MNALAQNFIRDRAPFKDNSTMSGGDQNKRINDKKIQEALARAK